MTRPSCTSPIHHSSPVIVDYQFPQPSELVCSPHNPSKAPTHMGFSSCGETRESLLHYCLVPRGHTRSFDCVLLLFVLVFSFCIINEITTGHNNGDISRKALQVTWLTMTLPFTAEAARTLSLKNTQGRTPKPRPLMEASSRFSWASQTYIQYKVKGQRSVLCIQGCHLVASIGTGDELIVLWGEVDLENITVVGVLQPPHLTHRPLTTLTLTQRQHLHIKYITHTHTQT